MLLSVALEFHLSPLCEHDQAEKHLPPLIILARNKLQLTLTHLKLK